MYFIDEIQNNRIKKNKFLLPIDDKNKRKNSMAILLTPNFKSSNKIMKYPLLTNKYYNGYFIQRSALYLISNKADVLENELPLEEACITEDFELLFKDAKNPPKLKKVSTFEDDKYQASRYITCRLLENICKEYHYKLTDNITMEIYRNNNLREPTEDIIYVSSYKTFNKKIWKSYSKYCLFCTYITLLKRINPKINRVLLYSTALYESGINSNNVAIENWYFSNESFYMTKYIDFYIKKNGKKDFIYKVIKNDDTSEALTKIFIKSLEDFKVNPNVMDILDLFNKTVSFEESYNNDTYDDPKTESDILSELDYIDLGNDVVFIFESDAYNTQLKTLLFKDRIKGIKRLKELYEEAKENNPNIKYTYTSIDKFKGLNFFYDAYYYNEVYMRNSSFKNIRGYNVYNELMNRLINDPAIPSDYKNKTVIIPINDWDFDKNKKLWMIQDTINPISVIYKNLLSNNSELKNYKDKIFLFLGENSYFKIDFNNFDVKKDTPMFLRNIKMLRNKSFVPEEDITDINEPEDSPKAIKVDVIDKVEKTQNVKIDDISKKEVLDDDSIVEKNKKELVNKIDDASKKSTKIDDAIDSLDDDEVKNIIIQLADEPEEGRKITAARADRILKLQNDLLDKKIKDVPMKDLLYTDDTMSELDEDLSSIKPIKLDVESVNTEWEELKFPNVSKSYNLNKDIINILHSFSDKNMSTPLYIKDIKVEDTSTSQDAVETYTIKYEDIDGKRFTIKLDIPIFIDGKYIKLRGNRKEIPYQLYLMPIIKTDQDQVQIVSNYNKIFISRFGSSLGKSMPSTNRLIKTIDKYSAKCDPKELSVILGNNTKICAKYELPIDYIDIAKEYTKFITKKATYYFNQDEIRSKYKDIIDLRKGIPIGYSNKEKSIIYYNTTNGIFSYYLYLLISIDLESSEFNPMYNSIPNATKYVYSRASILNNKIPLILVCAYSEGLEKVLRKANIEYQLTEKNPHLSKFDWDVIKYKDGYLSYKVDYDSSLLLNGLKDCPVSETSIFDINKKTTYISYLDYFGGRLISDGLDNFYDCMIDRPITYNTLQHYKLPTDYIEVLLYANQLLADNKYIKQSNLSSTRRIRREEQIAACLYEVMSKEYGRYCSSIKHGRGKNFSVKQSAVIDRFMQLNTSSDLSIINPLHEYESYNTVTPKGPSGMNSDRSYGLDKRGYDESMYNVLSMSTNAAGNVGIVRQATINANVEGSRGYIVNNDSNKNKLSAVNSLCMTEALTPFGTTSDDPFRTAMNFTQTSKHGMRVLDSDPLLVTTGADEALPYLVSNTFAFKAKQKGKVIEKTDDYLILEYKDGTKDFVSLMEYTEKNSSSGFFVTIKLDSDLKEGSTFKENAIVAYDKLSFSNKTGFENNIEYDIGCLSKIAIFNTDEGYEDSAVISEKLSEKMTSEVVICKTINVKSDSSIYNLVNKGQDITEGDDLMIIQNSFEDEDVNIITRNLAQSDLEYINDLGRIPIKSKVTGIVQDIVITRTVDIDDLSPTLKKIVTDYEKNIKSIKKKMESYGMDTKNLQSTEKLPMSGKLKNVDGVLIEIYLKYYDKMSVGDKFIYNSALKGVTKYIFPEGKEPYSEYRKDEHLDSLLSISSINARMAMSTPRVGVINKVLIELTRQCKDILGIKYDINL